MTRADQLTLSPAPSTTPVRVYTLTLVVPVALLALVNTLPVPNAHLLRDAVAVTEAEGVARLHFGLLSYLGIVALLVTAGAGLAAWFVTRTEAGDPNVSHFVLSGSLLTIAIALDDLLLLHESANRIAPHAELVVIGLYGLLALLFGLRFRTVVLRFDWGLLIMVGIALLVSTGVDTIIDSTSNRVILVEDGAKLIGYTAWSVFFVRAALSTAHERTRRHH